MPITETTGLSTPKIPSNYLLACLPEAEYQRLSPSLERVSLSLASVIYESGVVLTHVYFPIDCVVSLLNVMTNGDSAEIAVVGSEGMVGVSLFMGGQSTTSRAIVQSEGNAFRLKVDVLKAHFDLGGAMQHLLLRYTQALMTQITQTAACNLHHSVEQQLSRWLLMSLDRLPDNQVLMTQGLIANMLGVRRAGATDATDKLQTAGLITYKSGTITVLDRPGLQDHACECYAVVKKEYDRLLPEVTAS
ncbi:MAG: crp-like helix-turn-helix domain protein [Hydrocarboniphaga sp.]|uniref:Crp/Fnr family transcriptional regulator n=1 Tax=Hydrocarboniphaga sp. TaxID=2033016 RepID=UPI00262862C9|nr:Crp/Fnr family transcriptional regulator [Hydrocarboniphaga sp.]MDB5968481.1 crp-like helix-turn-helix domain protein [Hydrocarboniphaga sp.]